MMLFKDLIKTIESPRTSGFLWINHEPGEHRDKMQAVNIEQSVDLGYLVSSIGSYLTD
jgi:hypothetical protein